MKILQLRALRGPNLWSRFPTMYMELDLEGFAERPTHTHPGFTDLLMRLMPSLYQHRCGVGREGGFEGRMREGTYLGHVVEHVALELQCLAGMEVGFGKTRETSAPGVYHVVYRYRDEQAGLEAGRQAVGLVEASTQGRCVELAPILQRLREIREESMLGPSTTSIVEEAVARDIPFIRLNEASLVQLGWGAQQQRIQATLSGRTSALGVEIADDKFLTKKLLRRVGVPVPQGAVVDSAAEAAAAAEDLGFPVTIKPLVGNHGRGISVCVAGKEGVGPAYESALKVCPRAVVERHLEGDDFRILVVGHRMAAAARRTPAQVTGDGKRTIRELIDEVNRSEARGFGHEKVLTYITPDDMTLRLLRELGLDLESVPAAGRVVRLKSTANLSTGGTAEDVTDTVHPANRFMAERISRIVDLDIMGIDFVAPTLETPVFENGGGVVEVNAAPGFRMHLSPTHGKPRNVAVPVVDMLFGKEGRGRIPLVTVTGTNGKTTTVRLISHLLRTAGRRVGSTTTDSVQIENHTVLRGDYSGPEGAGVVLQDPTVNAAVLEIARGGILRRGLGFDRADVAVVLNVAEDHLGLEDVHDLDKLSDVKRVVAEAVHPEKGRVVLNADDPRVLAMKKKLQARAVLFSLDPDCAAVRRHLAEGGTVFTIEEAAVVLREGKAPKMPIVKVFEIPIALGGKALYNVSNALAAAAAAHALLGLELEDLKAGLSTFNPSIGQSPGRLNIIEIAGVDYLVDYAHNVPAFMALNQVVASLAENRPPGHRRIGVVSGTGNRRDEDIHLLGKAAAGIYTDLIIKDSDPRGRPPGETAEIMKRGVLAAGFPGARIRVVVEEKSAIEAAFDAARSGDLVVIQPDDIARTIRQLLEYKESHVSLDLGDNPPAQIPA
ncbi:MAG: cyanophycin synthetase [Elusimicrobiota bacterium]